MLETLKKALITLRVFDGDGTLSLTSCVMLVCLVKFAVSPLETETLVALLGAGLSYQAKKVINGKVANDKHAANLGKMAELVSDLSKRTVVLENRTAPVAGMRR